MTDIRYNTDTHHVWERQKCCTLIKICLFDAIGDIDNFHIRLYTAIYSSYDRTEMTRKRRRKTISTFQHWQDVDTRIRNVHRNTASSCRAKQQDRWGALWTLYTSGIGSRASEFVRPCREHYVTFVQISLYVPALNGKDTVQSPWLPALASFFARTRVKKGSCPWRCVREERNCSLH